MARKFKVEILGDSDYNPITGWDVSGLNFTTRARDGDNMRSVQEVCSYLQGLSGGSRQGPVTVRVYSDPVQATGSFTVSGAVTTTAVAINGTGITIQPGGGDSATAARLATLINFQNSTVTNANPNAGPPSEYIMIRHISHHVYAVAVGNVVNIFAKVPGVAGNAIRIAGGTNITASGARLTGGADGPSFTLSL